MQHDLRDLLRRILRVSLTPIIADGVRENASIPVERRRYNGPADLRIALQAVLGVFVPEVEGAVGAGGAEGAVLWVEGDGVDAVDVALVAHVRDVAAVAFEGEVGTVEGVARVSFVLFFLGRLYSLPLPPLVVLCLGWPRG